MEPFPKRQRLYSPIAPAFPQSFDSEDAYYDGDDFVVDEEEEDIEEPPPDLDPESDFQQKRARLDYKLKSTFEAIFEKYGRNFEGVGDEIDLATGEIVVNNGHILEMLDERDAGDVDGAQSVPTEVTEESGDLPSSVIEEISDTDEEEDDDEGSDEASDGEMIEDDLILRGFALANRFSRPSPELGSLRNPVRPSTSHRPIAGPSTNIPNPRLPSQSEILTRFGPQLGPQIVEYVSKQSAPKENPIEPAWRAPEIPAFKPRRQEVKEPVFFPPEPERSPSPEEATSIWALPQKRGRKQKPRISSIDHMGGESLGASNQREDYALDPAGLPVHMGDLRQASPVRKKRRKFTEEDDQILLDWVTRAKQKGLPLNYPLWRKLEATHPSHNWSSWEYRYKHHFTYLLSNSTEESEVSVSEPSIDSMFVAPQSLPAHRPNLLSHGFDQDTPRVRPNRIRRPAQKDSRIISWSEAVNALESLDPEIHAGIMHDAGITETSNPSFDHPSINIKKQLLKPASITQPTKQQAATRPPRSPPKEIIDLTNDLSDNEAAPTAEHHLIPSVPCPHADCRPYSKILYRLQRRENEELSEMCLHLFRIHHTTPYPCCEINCPRKGEEGYFMQADLVRHVRRAHPSLGALHRLRGRVDSELLDHDVELATPPSDPTDPSNRPVSQSRDSDFMSPRKFPGMRRTSSSHQHSSTSDFDRTPRASMTIPGMSRSTPMTSVSSMRVHHPSATKASVEEQVEDNNMHYMKYIDDISMRAQRSTRGSSDVMALSHFQPHAREVLPSLKGKEKESTSGARNSLPTPMTATGSFSESTFSFFDDISRPQRPALDQQQEFAGSQAASAVHKPASTIAETPDPAYPQAQKNQQTIPLAHIVIEISPKAEQSNPAQTFQRNIVDQAYEFSDEEAEPERVVEAAGTEKSSSTVVTKPPVAISSMGPPSAVRAYAAKTPLNTYSKKRQRVVKPASRLSFTTPAAQKAIRQSILRMALDAEDFDELSLDKDDVVLLSSQPRTMPLAPINPIVKQEDVMNTPRPLASAVSRKRTFSTFRDGSSPDELAAEDPSPSAKFAAASQPEIKEEDNTSLPEYLPPVASHRTGVQHLGLPPSQMTPSTIDRQMAIRTSTPLLNLTPINQALATNEILDSAAEESSPALPSHPPQRPRTQRQKAANTSNSSSPLTNLLTPTRPKHVNDFLKAEQVTVVVKTPNGTFRRCGEDEFMCGRSFCFRCGSGSGLKVGV